MTYTEKVDGWYFESIDGRIQMIQIDFRLSFLVSGKLSDIWIHIETPAQYRTGANSVSIIPARVRSVAPILDAFNAEIRGIGVTKTGELNVEFEDGRLVRVEPHHSYEAWQLKYSSGNEKLMLVCAPGGTVTTFKDSASAQDSVKLN